MIYLQPNLSHFMGVVRERFASQIDILISEPFDDDGLWFVDMRSGSYCLTVQYSPSKGFGVSAGNGGFGEGPDEVFQDADQAAARVLELLITKGLTIPITDFGGLRGSLTQVRVAEIMGIKQPSYAKMELQDLSSLRVETIEKIVEASGAHLVLMVQGADGRFFLLRDRPPEKRRGAIRLKADEGRTYPLFGLVATGSKGFDSNVPNVVESVASSVHQGEVIGLKGKMKKPRQSERRTTKA